jgi:SNF2 family DNA or RNA helicase
VPLADTTPAHPDDIIVTTRYTDRDRMTLIPGATYRGDSTWRVPLSWASCLVLRGIFQNELVIGSRLMEWARCERARIDRGMRLRMMLELPEITALDDLESDSSLHLFPFQRAAMQYLITMERAGLFEPMGVGKTPITIRTLQIMQRSERDPFPALVICPKSLKRSVWAREIARWAPELSVSVVDGGAAMRRKQITAGADVTIINWESVRLHSRVAGYGDIRLTDAEKREKELNELALQTVICDEAHRLCEPKSAQSRAVKWLLHRARYAFALTGTPVNDHAGDMWGILHAIAPAWHPGKTRYMERWVETGYTLYGGLAVLGLKTEREPEFRAVTEPLYRRIPKDILLPHLPPKLPAQIRETEMTAKQAKAYREMEEQQLTMLNEILAAKSQLTVLTRLLQFAAAFAEIHQRVDKNGIVHDDVVLAEPSGKIDDLIELLDEMGDEPLVVAAVSRQLLELSAARLEKHAISHVLMTGRQSTAERDQNVHRFQTGDARVIMMSLGTGAEGLTLTRARTILFMQEDWQPRLNAQAEDRIHRIGSEIHENIRIIKQITPGTVEERKPIVLSGKLARIEEVLQDKLVLARLLGGS